MSNLNILPGAFPELPGAGINAVAVDTPTNGVAYTHVTDRTPGFYAFQRLPDSPTSADAWDILAFTVSLRLGVVVDLAGGLPAGYQYWARFGDLWAGVVLDGTILAGAAGQTPIWPPGQFPSDLSTFDRIWDGSQDDIRVVNSSTITDFTLIARTFQLPFPPRIRSGSQLGFALILTPSILDPAIAIFVRSCQFSIAYTEITPRGTPKG